MHRLDQFDLTVEDSVELSNKLQVDAAMHLYGVQSGLERSVCDLLGCKSREDPYAFDVLWQIRGDSRHLRSRHLARARRKDEADSIRSQLGGQLCIVQIGVRADFDPH